MSDITSLISHMGKDVSAFPIVPSPMGRYLGAEATSTYQEIGELARLVAGWEARGSALLTYARISIGRLVMDYVRSYPIQIDYETAIQELELCEITRKKWNTVYNWVRVAERLPEGLMDYRLPMSVLEAVAMFPEPATPRRGEVFRAGREAVVAECLRSSKSAVWVSLKMRELAIRTKAIEPRQHIKKQELIRQAMVVFWLYGKPDNELEQLVTEDGSPITRREIAELREHYTLHLIDKGLLPEEDEPIHLPSIAAPRWAVLEAEEEERLKNIVHEPVDYSDLGQDEVWPEQGGKFEDE